MYSALSVDVNFEVLLPSISFSCLSINSPHTRRNLSTHTEVQAVTTALGALQIGSLKRTNLGNAQCPRHPLG